MQGNKKFKVVLSDYEWPDLSIENDLFTPLGIDFLAGHCEQETDVINLAQDADAVIAEYAPLTQAVIQTLKNCKIISMNAAGYNNVDVEAATDAGIMVVNCPDYCFEEVADHTMALLLACARGVVKFDRRLKDRIWDFKSAGQLFRLRDSVLGLVGFGRVAQAVAKRAQCFGVKVLATDPFVPQEAFDRLQVTRIPLEALLPQVDYLSLHTPLNSETRHLISASELSRMKHTAFLINMSRGEVVDEDALLQALTTGEIRGAALDVLTDEPPEFKHPLLGLDNIILTPHAAFYSQESMDEVRTRSAEQVVSVYQNQVPENVVNPEVLDMPVLRLTAV
jgi:D-3-phosphoglycerate dehydrogenase